MSYQPDPEEPIVLQIRQVKQRDIDYEDLTLVDHLVRDVLNGDWDLPGGPQTLARIVSSGHSRPRWAVTLGWGVMCAGVGLLLGGDAAVSAIAFVAAVCIDRLQLVMSRRRLPSFYRQVAGGARRHAASPCRRPRPRRSTSTPRWWSPRTSSCCWPASASWARSRTRCPASTSPAGARLTEALLATAGIIAGVSGGLTFADVLGVDVGRARPGRRHRTSRASR